MARGFESKMVEYNQEESARRPSKSEPMSAEEQARVTRRAGLQLTRARAVTDLDRATRPAHKAMLKQAIKALDEQIDEQ